MPFYEYVCDACGRATEILQRLSDSPATECPSCHAHALVKQVSAAGFRLKGGGWYETDFKSGDKRNLASDGTSGSGSTAAASDAAAPAGHSCSAGCSHAAKTDTATATSAAPSPAAT